MDSDDVPPVLEHNAAGRSPFLLTSDHYGRIIPSLLGDLGLPAGELVRHIAWDIGISGVAEALSSHLGAHLIAQRYSRLVIDCNRPPSAASSIPRISEATIIPGNDGITREAAEMRRQAGVALIERADVPGPFDARIDRREAVQRDQHGWHALAQTPIDRLGDAAMVGVEHLAAPRFRCLATEAFIAGNDGRLADARN